MNAIEKFVASSEAFQKLKFKHVTYDVSVFLSELNKHIYPINARLTPLPYDKDIREVWISIWFMDGSSGVCFFDIKNKEPYKLYPCTVTCHGCENIEAASANSQEELNQTLLGLMGNDGVIKTLEALINEYYL